MIDQWIIKTTEVIQQNVALDYMSNDCPENNSSEKGTIAYPTKGVAWCSE